MVLLAELESVFPRTFLAFTESDKKSLVGEFARKFPTSLDTKQICGLFPFFLSSKKWADRGFVPDLAALEWSLRLAKAAPEIPESGFEQVVTASEPQWFTAQFRFDPAHAVMVSDWPLDEVCAGPKELHQRSPGKFLIYRTQGESRVRRIEANEANLIEALSLGVPLGVILDRPGGPEFDAFLFHEWMQSGLLREIRWSEESSSIPSAAAGEEIAVEVFH